MFNAFPRKLVTLKNGRNESRNVFDETWMMM